MSGVAGPGRSGRIEGWSRTRNTGWLPPVLVVALVGVAAVVRETAPFIFLGILFTYLLARSFDRRSTALAAVLPVAAILVWRSIPQPLADPTGADCANVFAPPAVWRFLEAAVGLLALWFLVWDRKAPLAELGLVRGSRRVRGIAIGGLLVIAPIAVLGGTFLGGSDIGAIFFGEFRLDLSQPLAVLPAVLFAGSNALAEELAYRGAMRVWLTPSLGIVGANLAQAVLFGLAHTGQDFVGLEGAIPVILAMIVVGFVAGVVAKRTGSLTLPLAIHAAADIPIYLYWACQAT